MFSANMTQRKNFVDRHPDLERIYLVRFSSGGKSNLIPRGAFF
jgi:hypothetical protein